MTYAYELTWDDRYVEPMNWAVREYMVGNHSRHADGIWWNTQIPGSDDEGPSGPGPANTRGGRRRGASQPASDASATPPKPEYFCQTWLGDSVTNGYTQYLEIYPGSPYRKAVEAGIVNLADFILAHGVTPDFDGIYMGVAKPTAESTGYVSTPQIYANSMPNMAILTMAKAYYLTGDEKYADAARKLHAKACEHGEELSQLKPVTQGTYYPPMTLPYLDGTILPRSAKAVPVVAPANGWVGQCRKIATSFGGARACCSSAMRSRRPVRRRSDAAGRGATRRAGT